MRLHMLVWVWRLYGFVNGSQVCLNCLFSHGPALSCHSGVRLCAGLVDVNT